MKFLHRFSFRSKLLSAFMALTFIISLYIGIIVFNQSSLVIRERNQQRSSAAAANAADNLSTYFKSVQNHLTAIQRLPSLRTLAEIENVNTFDGIQYRDRLSHELRNTLYLAGADGTPFEMVNLHFTNGISFSSRSDDALLFSDYESVIERYENEGIFKASGYSSAIWCESLYWKDETGISVRCLVNVRFIYARTGMQRIGCIVSLVCEDLVKQQYAPYSDSAYLRNNSGQLLSTADSAMPSDATDRDATVRLLALDGVQLYLPYDYYREMNVTETNHLIISSVLFSIPILLISVLLTVVLSKSISDPLLELHSVVRRIDGGELTARFPDRGRQDEINYLGRQINGMLDQIANLFRRQQDNANTQHTLELQLLQSQINPHLLYNTLDSVQWVLEKGDAVLAQKLVTSMSRFFKIALAGGRDLIPLEMEMDMVQNYINIQCLARNQDILLTFDVDTELLSFEILKLTLQPLVENAVIHGFSGYCDDGQIDISAHIIENEILLSVTDNGIGLLPETLAELRHTLDTYPPDPKQHHFGLYNVHRRIRTRYGHGYGLEFFSEVGNYTTFSVRFPTVEQKEETCIP